MIHIEIRKNKVSFLKVPQLILIKGLFSILVLGLLVRLPPPTKESLTKIFRSSIPFNPPESQIKILFIFVSKFKVMK